MHRRHQVDYSQSYVPFFQNLRYLLPSRCNQWCQEEVQTSEDGRGEEQKRLHQEMEKMKSELAVAAKEREKNLTMRQCPQAGNIGII